MNVKKIVALCLCAVLTIGTATIFADDAGMTRGAVAQRLQSAADDYNPDVQKEDIIKGYEDGELHEDRIVNRAEALVMLRRAFGELPTLSGHNARSAFPAETFTDVPQWAQTELYDVFASGIVAGKSQGIFAPADPVTSEQLELFIHRIYALFATNEKDDFYATVNKDTLEKLEIKPGRVNSGTLYDLQEDNTTQITQLLDTILVGTYGNGTKEQKISDFYNCVMDMEGRNKTGTAPITPYLSEIDGVKNVKELEKVQVKLMNELMVAVFTGFSLTIDSKDSTKYIPSFSALTPNMTKDFYTSSTPQQMQAYKNYLTQMLTLCGEEGVAEKVDAYIEFEKLLADKQMKREEMSDVDKTYNLFTYEEIKQMFDGRDIDAILMASGIKKEDKFEIVDIDCTREFATLFTDENIDVLKTAAKLGVILSYGGALSQDFTDASDKFNQEYLGISGSYTDKERAVAVTENVFPDYIGEIYAEKYFSESKKQDVVKMVNDIISVYKERIASLEWMSDATKAKAISKLDKMGVKIGYPDKLDTYLDNVSIKSPSAGGSYFSNILNIAKAQRAEIATYQGKPVDKTKWAMYPFTVNACYSPTSNDITFPAAILQKPMYDENASYVENLGSIGYIIAHEITHAFDNNGAKYDENGNATDWWTAEDYAAFDELCKKVVEFYDGQENIPGVYMNGTLTLSENVADLGSLSCLTELAAKQENPDYKAFYTSVAKAWASTRTREFAQYLAMTDLHSADKLRVNRTVVNFEEFYKAFGITDKDGMYVAPENRVSIW